ncbi:DUF362 domain-containing protein [Candidatus Bathyarchaeota archaeon]|nr:DUF362 domain-containing protein [Candidatus Bathyarchaeota archaeon]
MKKVREFLKNLMKNPYFLGFVSLLWLLFRSGTKPSRITYPCQRASATISFHLLIYPLLMPVFIFLKKFLKISSRAQRVSGRRVLSVFLVSLSLVVSVLAVYANIIINPGAVLSERAASTGRKTTVSLVRVNGGSLEESLREAINLIGGIDYYIPPRSKILIKPNIVRNQKPPDTTDPAIVEALINIIRRKNPSVIWIADGSGEGNTLENFKSLGYLPVAERTGAILVDLNYGEMINVSVPGGGVIFNSFLFNRIVMEADVFISLACMKTHSQAVVTLTMKNLIGIAPGSIYGYPPSPTKWILHEKAEEKGDQYMAGVIVDLCRARKIDLAIIDGRTAMEGQGPHEGDPVKLDLLIVGADPVATDTVASAIMGFDPEKVPTLRLANQLGLGTNNLHEIEIKGERIEESCYPFKPAAGHGNFQLFSTIERELYRWRINLAYISAALWIITLLTVGSIKTRRQRRQQHYRLNAILN